VLSRRLVEQGHYPAIDIEASISRAMNNLVSPGHFTQVQHFKHLYAHYQRNRDLINVGAYVNGSDPLLDEAIMMHSRLSQFLKQDMYVADHYAESMDAFAALFEQRK
jgi:flagellum-specific ATP synthase